MMIADQEILNLPRLSLNMKDSLLKLLETYPVSDKNETIWYIEKVCNIWRQSSNIIHCLNTL